MDEHRRRALVAGTRPILVLCPVESWLKTFVTLTRLAESGEAVTRPGVCTTAPDKEPHGSPNASGAQGRAGLGHPASRAPSGPRFSLACSFFFFLKIGVYYVLKDEVGVTQN